MSIDTQSIVTSVKKYPILVICGVVGIVLLITLYMRSDLMAVQKAELDKYSAESSRHRANIANSAQLQDQLDFLIQANNAVRDRALSTGGLAQNLQYFYRLEADAGVKYLDIRPGSTRAASTSVGKPAAAAATYVPLNYIINVQGDFVQIISYLRSLEQGAYFCRINSAMASGSGSIITVNLNLDLLGVP